MRGVYLDPALRGLTLNKREAKMIQVITNIDILKLHTQKGVVRVLTRNGKYDIIKGSFLMKYVEDGYVLGIVV